MIIREVTVGRAADSDILYDARCVHVSNAHAVIYWKGNQLVFKDISTNGTLINNTHICHQSVIINYGDSILLAGKYPLTWDRIGVFFPFCKQPTQVLPNNKKHTVYNTGNSPHACVYAPLPVDVQNVPFEKYTDMSIAQRGLNVETETTKWNWGAFFLYPFWGFANGTWWAFLIAVFFGWSIIPNIVFGILGSKWAWQNKRWRDLNHYIEVQSSWKKWGIGLFLGSIAISLLFWMLIMGLAMSY